MSNLEIAPQRTTADDVDIDEKNDVRAYPNANLDKANLSENQQMLVGKRLFVKNQRTWERSPPSSTIGSPFSGLSSLHSVLFLLAMTER